MSLDYLLKLSTLLLGSLAIAVLALWGFAWLAARKEKAKTITLQSTDDEIVFLFDDETLVNATSAAKAVLSSAPNVGSDWSRLLSIIISRFPDLQKDIAKLVDLGSMVLESQDGTTLFKCEWRNGLARLTLIDRETEGAPSTIDHHSFLAMEQEIASLRSASDNLPYLVWREMPNGTINWANNSYLALADQLGDEGDIPTWPPRNLFDSHLLANATPKDSRRVCLKTPNGDSHWFDVFRFQIDDDNLFAANSADLAVKAEVTLREFTQTLTKTFSHLTIGLAVFDRKRRLVLFNPALTDLTSLPPDFLITRPALTTFLDRLRDCQMMPEPKDYKSWRQEMSALETAAEDGTYEEVWTLPGGMTYRISGRPHPDGAIAFLFEDISAEMSLTRRFRSEIETGQAVLDSLDEAIAVFSNEGVMVMANAAYSTLWGLDALEGLSETNILDATRIWHSKCAPSPIWGDIRDFTNGMGERSEWSGHSRLWDGRRLACRIAPLPGGSTLVGFTPDQRVSRILGHRDQTVLVQPSTQAAEI